MKDVTAAAEGGFLSAIETTIPGSVAIEESAEKRTPAVMALPNANVSLACHALLSDVFDWSPWVAQKKIKSKPPFNQQEAAPAI